MSDMNAKRAQWAQIAVRAFAEETSPDDTKQAVGDLICDLGHFCDRSGLDFLQLIVHAVAVWHAEKLDPIGLAPEPYVTISVDSAS